ncbi:hypothetical protein N7539_004600 [Penicillium diatomitis]|uniref:HMG box domain-containing protein n=1 Tax=Penicillium diatomitis TaxID=2819901 RepID=A0A9W9XE60_9EURO|nr:uncharacterized protein N7539_004600 [Penicillium diatomitis]KAJ5489710.1 hypothetical protein N7539_004600 [Penicillium diatomitis]
MSYDRVLPNPVSLRHETASLFSLPRPSDLLDHKIMAGPPAKPYMALPHRPNPGTVENTMSDGVCFLSHDQPNNVSQTHQHLMSFESRPSLGKLDSRAATSPGQRLVKPGPTITTSDLGPPRSVSPSESSSPAKSAKSDGLQFCLCQPEPKIPRPRNAFILYRQHYQSIVVAHNPGMANPEISKVIGEQWRSLSEDEKGKWKALAEEEKIRHAQQYPEYRYQPRRLGRDGSTRNLASGISHNPSGGSTCNRCGGRIMNAPASPMTPFTPIVAGSGSGSRENLSTRSSFPHMTTTTTTVMTASSSQCHSKAEKPPKLIHLDRIDRNRNRKLEDAHAVSPDMKRRRVSHSTGLKPSTSGHREISPESPYPRSPHGTVTSAHPSRKMMPLVHSRAVPTVPGQTPHPMIYHPAPSVTPVQAQAPPMPDPSLKLPPLKTTIASTPMTPRPTVNASVEKAVMTIPFLNKIKLLAKISPPLVPSFREGSSSRGPVVAVDGQDANLVRIAVEYIQRLLAKEEKFSARIFDGPELQTPRTTENGGPMRDATVDYLNTISAWHRISDEIIEFVRNDTNHATQMETNILAHSHVLGESSPNTQIDSIIQHNRPSPDPSPSPRSIIPRTASLQLGSPESIPTDSESPRASPSTSVSVLANEHTDQSQSRMPGLTPSLTPTPTPTPSSSSPSRVPVALVPRYQLTTADTFACSVPINDSYAPLDHWQWMASLWRTCVGPDITVYVRECSREEIEQSGTVEIRLADAGTVILRKLVGASTFEEKALKRMGFEIEDFLTQ